MTRFSANLGFLWNDLPLAAAIRAARAAGFDAVECHWPYDTPAREVVQALEETGMEMLGLNTRRGNADNGEFGLAAIPGREAEARVGISEGLAYAAATRTRNLHVMAGVTTHDSARACFEENLLFACDAARLSGTTILIEPINGFDVPGYFLSATSQAAELIARLDQPNLKLMFDCYHVQRMEGEILPILQQVLPIVGHVQFAAVPDRGPPDHGEVDYRTIFSALAELGYKEPLGAEYRCTAPTEATLGWMHDLRD